MLFKIFQFKKKRDISWVQHFDYQTEANAYKKLPIYNNVKALIDLNSEAYIIPFIYILKLDF